MWRLRLRSTLILYVCVRHAEFLSRLALGLDLGGSLEGPLRTYVT